MKIEEIRKQIDAVDDEIARLYGERMARVLEIAAAKAKCGASAADPEREKRIIKRVAKAVKPELRGYLERVFQALFETSREYQKELKVES